MDRQQHANRKNITHRTLEPVRVSLYIYQTDILGTVLLHTLQKILCPSALALYASVLKERQTNSAVSITSTSGIWFVPITK